MLKLLGKIYGYGGSLRNALYDREVLRSYSLDGRTISVGNLTLGGTGKTPLVALIAEILAEAGETVCILTRGYGRNDPDDRLLVSNRTEVLADAFAAGDEPIELAKQLIGKAIVVADRNRVSAATWAKEKFDVTAFILDDGFQHRRVKRDLDIVCIDATDPYGDEGPLRGWLREPFHNVSRANAIVITRSDMNPDVSGLTKEIGEHNRTADIYFAKMKLLQPKRLEDFLGGVEGHNIGLGRAFAFAGLGNPKLFSRSLESAGYQVAGSVAFSDHVRYTQSHIDSLVESARKCGATSLVTTAKDAVKLGGLDFMIPCFVIEVRAEVEDTDRFRRFIISS
jgi:tetraacyldisaccharide 4'-kinase